MKKGPKRKEMSERFLDKVLFDTNGMGCWLWLGSKSPKGYGRIGRPGRRHVPMIASRFSYEYFNGEIPEDTCVLHRCDNPSCVNPNHLFLGSLADNIADKVRKGRQPCGEVHICSKLTSENVIDIRRDNRSWAKIARSYNVSTGTIGDIKQGKTWKHLL